MRGPTGMCLDNYYQMSCQILGLLFLVPHYYHAAMANKCLVKVNLLFIDELLECGHFADLFKDVCLLFIITIRSKTCIDNMINITFGGLGALQPGLFTCRVITSVFKTRQAIDKRVQDEASVTFDEVVQVTNEEGSKMLTYT